MPRSIGFALLCLAVVVAPTAGAHDTWLGPIAPAAPGGEWGVALTTGHAFPALEQAPAAQRVRRAEVIAPSGALPLVQRTRSSEALPYRVLVEPAPVVAAVVALAPRITTLDEAAVARYLRDEIGESPVLLARHRALGRWRERYTKNAKSLLRLDGRTDTPDAAGIATRPHGLPYELVPSIDPTRRAPGDPLQVCAFAKGRPVRDADVPLRIGLVEAAGATRWAIADADGCASLRPSAVDGYLLRSVLIRPLDAADADWDSHFATLTVGIAAAPPTAPAEESSP